MYSEEFMAYLAAYKKDEVERKKAKPSFVTLFIKSVFKSLFGIA